MQIRAWIQSAQAALAANGVRSPKLEAELLLAHSLGVTRTYLLAHEEDEAPVEALNGLLMRRLAHEPLAYLLGSREFYGRSFLVNRHVLIPRHETETLVETALEFLTRDSDVVLDLGTGSGCMASTLALEKPRTAVLGLDRSIEALRLAALNGERLGAAVHWVLGDWLTAVRGHSCNLIVSNPPYIASAETLDQEVAQYEPASALFSGPTGLEAYESIARQASRVLIPDGLVLLEVGHRQSELVSSLFRDLGWKEVCRKKDLSGVERVLGFTPGSRS